MKSVKFAIAGAILFVLGFCMATGVDVNPIQALYTLPLMGGSLLCFKTAERLEARESEKKSQETTIGGVLRDAA